MRNQWKQGLQWGALGWLVHLVARYTVIIHRSAPYGLDASLLVPAAAWTAALALLWTRWSRAGVAVAIGTHVAVSLAESGTVGVAWAAALCVPTMLPLLPLLFMELERPRLTLALALVGRRRDALRQLAGWRWPLIAVGVYLLARSADRALGCNYLDGENMLRFAPVDMLFAFTPQVVLFGLAALPRRRSLAMA